MDLKHALLKFDPPEPKDKAAHKGSRLLALLQQSLSSPATAAIAATEATGGGSGSVSGKQPPTHTHANPSSLHNLKHNSGGGKSSNNQLQPKKAASSSSTSYSHPTHATTAAPPVEDILNAILPPIPVTDAASGEPQSSATTAADGGVMREGALLGGDGASMIKQQTPPEQQQEQMYKCVSSVPANRLDAVRLQKSLDESLLRRRARDSGVCRVRSEVYADAFDELIRQVTLDCPERGLLLLRIRDGYRQNLAAHHMCYRVGGYGYANTKVVEGQRLYDLPPPPPAPSTPAAAASATSSKPMMPGLSSSQQTAGNNRTGNAAATAANNVSNNNSTGAGGALSSLAQKIEALEEEKRVLQVQVQVLQAKCEETELDAQQRRAIEEKKHMEILHFYRRTQGQLHSQLKNESEKKG